MTRPATEPSAQHDDAGPLDAGELGAWVAAIGAALRGEAASDVPCGSCTACCTSSQFVPIAPDETDTLAHIPRALLFPAPMRPAGHVLLGYDERGHCPMLVDGACSIYAHRPRTCRTYDCRVFAAAGIDADADKPRIRAQARRWRFTHAGHDVTVRHDAMRRAAASLREHADALPADAVPVTETQRAVLAVELAELFVTVDADGAVVPTEPPVRDVAVVLQAKVRTRRR